MFNVYKKKQHTEITVRRYVPKERLNIRCNPLFSTLLLIGPSRSSPANEYEVLPIYQNRTAFHIKFLGNLSSNAFWVPFIWFYSINRRSNNGSNFLNSTKKSKSCAKHSDQIKPNQWTTTVWHESLVHERLDEHNVGISNLWVNLWRPKHETNFSADFVFIHLLCESKYNLNDLQDIWQKLVRT